MNTTYSFGSWIKRRRKSLDLTQRTLAELAYCSVDTVKKIESDRRRPSRELAQSLAEALLLPAEQHDLFIECARGLQPVDRLDAQAPYLDREASPSSPTNLPNPLTSLVNRVQTISEISAILAGDDVRLVTLIGPPGIGKTRLCIQCGQKLRPHFPGGVWYLDLASITDAALVMPAVAAVLNVSLAARPPIQQISRVLANKRLLLVMDNLEQVVAGAAVDVVDLLRACPGLKVLATSRMRLDVYGEYEYHVPPLSLPPPQRTYRPQSLLAYESVQLLVSRIRQHWHDFQVSEDNATDIAQLCRRLDGIPLALELAAARTRQLTFGQLVEELGDPASDESLLGLDTTARDLPPRQRSLYNAICSSYGQLQPIEQAVLCQLGVFVGPFDSEAAEAVCQPLVVADPARIGGFLTTLVDDSLLVRESREAPQRWRLMEMIREFALAQLKPDELAAARERHAVHFWQRLQALPDEEVIVPYLAAVDDQHDNFRSALDWAIEHQDGPIALGSCLALSSYWELRGFHSEGLPRLSRALALPDSGDPRLRLDVLWAACNLEWQRHAFDSALAFAGQATALVRQHGMDDRLPGLLDMQGRIHIEQGDYRRAQQVLIEAVRLSRQRPEFNNPGRSLAQLGEVLWAEGQAEEGKIHLVEAVGRLAEEKLNLFSAMAWTDLAEISLSEEDYPAVQKALQEAFPHAATHIRRMRILLVTLAGWLLMRPSDSPQDVRAAANLLGAEAGLEEQTSGLLAPFQQALIQERQKMLAQRLAPPAWKEAWQEGREWTLEQAVGEAKKLIFGQ